MTAEQWISVEEQIPEIGTECLVWSKQSWEKEPSAKIDRWDEQREAPVSFSSATIPIGPGWDKHDFESVSHWMLLPPPPGTEAQPAPAAPQPAEQARQPLSDDERRELLDWASACRSAYHIESTPGHWFGGFPSLGEQKEGDAAYTPIYVVPTGESSESGLPTYTLHEARVPMADQEVLFRSTRYTQAELDAARARGKEIAAGLNVDDGDAA